MVVTAFSSTLSTYFTKHFACSQSGGCFIFLDFNEHPEGAIKKIQLKYILLCISSAKVKKKWEYNKGVTDYQWQSKTFRPRQGAMESISLFVAAFRLNDMNACLSSRNQKEGLNSDTGWKTDLIQEEKDKPLMTGLLLQLCSKICPAHVWPPRASRIRISWRLQTNYRCSSDSGEAEVIRIDACVLLEEEMTSIWLNLILAGVPTGGRGWVLHRRRSAEVGVSNWSVGFTPSPTLSPPTCRCSPTLTDPLALSQPSQGSAPRQTRQ